jgi:hypothetical protein
MHHRPLARHLTQPMGHRKNHATLTTQHSTGTPTVQLSFKKSGATTTLTHTLPLSLNSSNPNVIAHLLAPPLLVNAQSFLTT